jgi:hypothetical protein
LSFAAATSLTSSPYVNVRPDSECTTAILCASCFLMASKMGRRGSVDAILVVAREGCMQQQRLNWLCDKDLLCLARVRENKFRAHMAVEAPRISTERPRSAAIGAGFLPESLVRSIAPRHLFRRLASSKRLLKLYYGRQGTSE